MDGFELVYVITSVLLFLYLATKLYQVLVCCYRRLRPKPKPQLTTAQLTFSGRPNKLGTAQSSSATPSCLPCV